METHQSENFPTLWYRIGHINGNEIEWNGSYQYDKGQYPKIAVHGNTVTEVHESENFKTLYYRIGTYNPNTYKINWLSI